MARTLAGSPSSGRAYLASLRYTASVKRSSASVRGSAACWSRDRKSTRLNSSHTVISYAVFCLKKKKRYVKEGQALCVEFWFCGWSIFVDLGRKPTRVGEKHIELIYRKCTLVFLGPQR